MTRGGRPSKYNWEAIKEAFESGFDRDEICNKYKITPKILSNKINKEKWAVKGSVKADVIELSEQVHKTAQNITKLHPKNQELASEVFSTRTEDEELMTNNRKISKLLQSVIIQNRNNITLQNIRNVSGTIRDIENIANPQSNKQEINIQNTNAQQTINKIEREIID